MPSGISPIRPANLTNIEHRPASPPENITHAITGTDSRTPIVNTQSSLDTLLISNPKEGAKTNEELYNKAKELINQKFKEVGHNNFEDAYSDAIHILKEKKDPSAIKKTLSVLSEVPKALMGVDGFDEMSAAITVNKLITEATKNTATGSVFSVLVGIGLYGAQEEWREKISDYADLLGEIAQTEDTLKDIVGDTKKGIANQEQSNEKIADLLKNQTKNIISRLLPKYVPEHVSSDDQKKLDTYLANIDSLPAEKLPKFIEEFSKFQFQLVQKQIDKIDKGSAQDLTISMAGMLGAMLTNTAQGITALVGIGSNAQPLLDAAKTMGDIIVPGIFLPSNILASRAGKRAYQAGKLEERRLNEAQSNLQKISNMDVYKSKLNDTQLVANASDHYDMLKRHNKRENINHGKVYGWAQAGMATTSGLALLSLALPPVAIIAKIIGIPSAAITIADSLVYKTYVDKQGDKYRGLERNASDANDAEILSEVAPQAIRPPNMETRRQELNAKLGSIAENDAHLSPKLTTLKAVSMMNSAIRKGKSGVEGENYIARGIKHPLFQRTGLSPLQQNKLMHLSTTDKSFKNLKDRIDKADTKLDKQVVLLQRLLDPEKYQDNNAPRPTEIIGRLITILEKTITKQGDEARAEESSLDTAASDDKKTNKRHLFKKKNKSQKSLLDDVGKSQFSWKRFHTLNIPSALDNMRQAEELQTKLNSSQGLTEDETNSLNKLTETNQRNSAAVEKYLHRAIGKLISTEKAWTKGDRQDMFNRLDQLNQEILNVENFYLNNNDQEGSQQVPRSSGESKASFRDANASNSKDRINQTNKQKGKVQTLIDRFETMSKQ